MKFLRNAAVALALLGAAGMTGTSHAEVMSSVMERVKNEFGNFPKTPATVEDLYAFYERFRELSERVDIEVTYKICKSPEDFVVRRNNGAVFDNFGFSKFPIRSYDFWCDGNKNEEDFKAATGILPVSQVLANIGITSGPFELSRSYQPADAILLQRLIEGISVLETNYSNETYHDGNLENEEVKKIINKGTATYAGRECDVFEYKILELIDAMKFPSQYATFGPEDPAAYAWIYFDKETGVPLAMAGYIDITMLHVEMRAARISNSEEINPPAQPETEKKFLIGVTKEKPAQPDAHESKSFLPDGTIAWFEHVPFEGRIAVGSRYPLTHVVSPDRRKWEIKDFVALAFSADGRKIYGAETSYDEVTGYAQRRELMEFDFETNLISAIKLPLDYTTIAAGHIGDNLTTSSGCLVVPGYRGRDASRIDLLAYRGKNANGGAEWSLAASSIDGVTTNYAVSSGANKIAYLMRTGPEFQQAVFVAELNENCFPEKQMRLDVRGLDGYKMDVRSNITISPDGSQTAVTAFKGSYDVFGIPVISGAPFEDEDIFEFRIPATESNRARVDATHLENSGYGFLFERASDMNVITNILKYGVSGLFRSLDETTQIMWRGRDWVIGNSGIVVYQDNGDIKSADAASSRDIAAGTEWQAEPLLSGNGNIYYHSVNGRFIAGLDVFGSVMRIPANRGNLDRLSEGQSNSKAEKILGTRGEAPYFIVYSYHGSRDAQKKEPETKAVTAKENSSGNEIPGHTPGLKSGVSEWNFFSNSDYSLKSKAAEFKNEKGDSEQAGITRDSIAAMKQRNDSKMPSASRTNEYAVGNSGTCYDKEDYYAEIVESSFVNGPETKKVKMREWIAYVENVGKRAKEYMSTKDAGSPDEKESRAFFAALECSERAKMAVLEARDPMNYTLYDTLHSNPDCEINRQAAHRHVRSFVFQWEEALKHWCMLDKNSPYYP